jgi:hypothetical protein
MAGAVDMESEPRPRDDAYQEIELRVYETSSVKHPGFVEGLGQGKDWKTYQVTHLRGD